MCLNCGCGMIDDPHDSAYNLTADDVVNAAEQNDQTLDETISNMMDGLQALSRIHHQNIGMPSVDNPDETYQ